MNYNGILKIIEGLDNCEIFDTEIPTLIYEIPEHYVKMIDRELYDDLVKTNDGVIDDYKPNEIVECIINGYRMIFYPKGLYKINFEKIIKE